MPGSIDGFKLAYAVHERWPLIKIILVSGQLKLTDEDKPADSRFFGKPLDVKQMIAEMQDMMGKGALENRAGRYLRADSESAATESATAPLRPGSPGSTQEFLTAENDSLRLLLEQAGIDAKVLLAQAGIDAKEREAADKLQKLILEELHHRIKNTLATVSAIASQSLRTATSIEHGQQAIEGRLVALGRAHDLLLQAQMGQRQPRTDHPRRDRALCQQRLRPDLDRGPRHQDHVGSRDRARHDAQRALHQHHQIRCAVGAGGPHRDRLDRSMKRRSGCN